MDLRANLKHYRATRIAEPVFTGEPIRFVTRRNTPLWVWAAVAAAAGFLVVLVATTILGAI